MESKSENQKQSAAYREQAAKSEKDKVSSKKQPELPDKPTPTPDSQQQPQPQPEPPSVNLKFYSNEISSEPRGNMIDKIHQTWWKNYDLLEQHHGYIQWLFPNTFPSRFNPAARPITTKQQIDTFVENKQVYERYIKSYQMMLQFYGIKLKNKATGELDRCRTNPYYLERYQKTLLTMYHNHMRITRILASLTLLGFASYARELALFLRNQIKGAQGRLRALDRIQIYEREWQEFTKIDLKECARSKYFDSLPSVLKKGLEKEPMDKKTSSSSKEGETIQVNKKIIVIDDRQEKMKKTVVKKSAVTLDNWVQKTPN